MMGLGDGARERAGRSALAAWFVGVTPGSHGSAAHPIRKRIDF